MGEMQNTAAPVQVYPQDLIFQRYLLALAVQDPTFLAANRSCLFPEHFGDQSLKFLSKAILQFYDQYGQTPSHAALYEWSMTVLRTGKHRDIAQLILDVCNFIYQVQVPNSEYIASRAVHFARWQGLKRAVLHGIQVLRQDGDPVEAMGMFEDALSLGVVQEGDEDIFDVAARMPEVWQQMVDRRGVIPTMFIPSFDRALHAGGPRRGELYVFQAPHKSGKSFLLCRCGITALIQGLRVLHVTIGDLKEFDVEHRYLSGLTGAPLKQVIHGGRPYYRHLHNVWLQPNQLRVKYYPPYKLTTANLRAYMSWLRSTKNFKPDMLIVDYPDKMLFDRSNTYGEMGRIYMELQEILTDFDCVGWAVSQSNRGSAKESLNTSANVSESWDKPANADGFIPITRLDKQGKEVKEATLEDLDFDTGDHSGHMIAYVESVRFGHDGFQLKLYYDFTRCFLAEDSPYTKAAVNEQGSMEAAQQSMLMAQQNSAMYRSGQWQR